MQLSPLQMLTKEEQTDTFQQTSLDKYQGSLHLSGALANKHISRQQNSANLDMTVTDPGGVVDDMQLSSSLSRLTGADGKLSHHWTLIRVSDQTLTDLF